MGVKVRVKGERERGPRREGTGCLEGGRIALASHQKPHHPNLIAVACQNKFMKKQNLEEHPAGLRCCSSTISRILI